MEVEAAESGGGGRSRVMGRSRRVMGKGSSRVGGAAE